MYITFLTVYNTVIVTCQDYDWQKLHTPLSLTNIFLFVQNDKALCVYWPCLIHVTFSHDTYGFFAQNLCV